MQKCLREVTTDPGKTMTGIRFRDLWMLGLEIEVAKVVKSNVVVFPVVFIFATSRSSNSNSFELIFTKQKQCHAKDMNLCFLSCGFQIWKLTCNCGKNNVVVGLWQR